MQETYSATAAEGSEPRRLFVYNGGFLTQKRIRRILTLAGWKVQIGRPVSDDDWVGVWGASPTSHRGEAVAARNNAPILRVEDAFLRSILPGRSGKEPPLGLLLDKTGVHFDSSRPSDLETLLATHPLDDTHLLNRARAASDWIIRAHLSKYNGFDPESALPQAPYVLVIDQTRGDASIDKSGADPSRFKEMLYWAQEEFPTAQILIKTHPETVDGHRQGHFGPEDCSDRISLFSDPVSPWALFEGALAVYTVSSGLGFEAIFANHKPRVFGQPFYAGWGLTDDRFPVARRRRNLTKAQLFAGAMILYPKWYDPYRDCLCELEDAIATLESETRAWRQDHQGHVAMGMRLWKRSSLQKFAGQYRRIRFVDDPQKAAEIAQTQSRSRLVWAGKKTEEMNQTGTRLYHVEDGFLRSRGLGAELTPPLSLVLDELGIYYDPTRESRMERLIERAASLPEPALNRAQMLVKSLINARLSKYNLDQNQIPDLPQGRRILVPGQVEDDASILTGCDKVRTNKDLLAQTRQKNPDAVILYKPHPDVEAGLRNGALSADDMAEADMVLSRSDPLALIDAVDEIWTMTSLLGFEALLRGRKVVCFGAPFYAGWGLTTDMAAVPDRRRAKPSLAALAQAALIDYPRYFDPKTQHPCPPEVIIDRLSNNDIPRPGALNRSLSKIQGLFASYSWIWR